MSTMDIISYSELRQNLASVMDEVTGSNGSVVVTRQKARPVVLMSYDEFRSWQETLHLMRSPANAARLLRSIASADKADLHSHDLIEPEEPEDEAGDEA